MRSDSSFADLLPPTVPGMPDGARDKPLTVVRSSAGFPGEPSDPSLEMEWPDIRGYEFLSVIGTGGMGIVYKARHRTLERTVAIKMLRGGCLTDPECRHRFYLEAEAVARLQHPNIIQVFELGLVEPPPGDRRLKPFMALEYVDGGTLAAHTDAPRSPAYAVAMVEKLARAVHAAHELGVVHRDLKPANVLLTREGEPKIADFGLAKQFRDERADAGFVTIAGTVMGTPEYMAPEQVASQDPGPAIDIYALGVILYELLTGRVPFLAATPEETMFLVRYQEPVSPRCLEPHLPRDLETICLKCLEKVSSKRYATALALAEDLARWAHGLPIQARPLGLGEQTLRWARRNPAVASLSAAVVLVALTGLSGVLWKWREAQQQANAAEQAVALARDHAQAERWERYRANIVAASSALQVHNFSAAREAVEASPEEFRNWEWRYFQQQTDLAQDVLAWPDAVVSAAVVTPDGTAAALLNVDDSVRVWDVRSRQEKRTFLPLRDQVHMMLSPDGRTLTYPSSDNSCVLCDIATDQRRYLRGHEKRVRRICFSRDASRVATLGMDGACRVWDAATCTALLTCPGPGLGGIEFSQDGQRLAALQDREVQVWDVGTGKQTALLQGHEHPVHGLCFNAGGSRLLTVEVHPGNTIRLWDVPTGQLRAVLRGHTNRLHHLAFSPDDRRIASAGLDQTIRLWDGATGQLRATLSGHKGAVNRVLFSPDSRYLLSGSQDHTLRLWDAESGLQLAILGGHDEEIFDLAFSADGADMVSVSRDATVRTWKTLRAARNGTLRGHTDYVYDVAVHPDGQGLASASWDGTVRLWDVRTGQQQALFDHGSKKNVYAVAFHPAGRLLASLCRDDSVRLWDLQTGQEVHRWRIPTNDWRDMRLAFHPQGDLLAVGGKDYAVHILDVNRREELAILTGHRDVVRDVAFSPDGRWLASAGDSGDRTIRIWDVASWQRVQVLEGHTFGICALAFQGEGRLLASGSTDGTVRLWDTTTWRQVAVQKHGANVYGVAFTPDGTRLACACQDNTIRFWDVRTHQQVATLHGHEAYVHALAFSPDGHFLVSGAGDCTVRVWNSVRADP
jgi:WD40 repeat protein